MGAGSDVGGLNGCAGDDGSCGVADGAEDGGEGGLRAELWSGCQGEQEEKDGKGEAEEGRTRRAQRVGQRGTSQGGIKIEEITDLVYRFFPWRMRGNGMAGGDLAGRAGSDFGG